MFNSPCRELGVSPIPAEDSCEIFLQMRLKRDTIPVQTRGASDEIPGCFRTATPLSPVSTYQNLKRYNGLISAL